MQKAVSTKDTGYNSIYIDISNHEREVKHSVVLNDNDKEELENEIVEELYRIFTHNYSGKCKRDRLSSLCSHPLAVDCHPRHTKKNKRNCILELQEIGGSKNM